MHTKYTTKIFLDSGDPQETQDALRTLGFLDGQTTNPSLIVKNLKARNGTHEEQKHSEQDLLRFYQETILEIRSLLDTGQSISIEVYADADTSAEEMIKQGEKMNTWIPNAHIKLPVTPAGLTAATHLVHRGINVNMTLCFSLEQALAVHGATVGCTEGQVYISPFIGRLDAIGESGIGLVKDILDAYYSLGSKVEVLAASIRSLEHVQEAVALGCDSITIPYKILAELDAQAIEKVFTTPAQKRVKRDIVPHEEWSRYNLDHPLTTQGLATFAEDWKSIFTPHH